MPRPDTREITCQACGHRVALGLATWGAHIKHAARAYAKHHGPAEALTFERLIRAACGRVMK